MADFLTQNWLWLTFLILVTPVATLLLWELVKAWHLNLSAWTKGLQVGIGDLLLLRLRRADTTLLINQLLVAKHAGIDLTLEQVAANHLGHGNLRVVVAALIAAKRFGFPLNFERAAAVDQVGKDPLQLIADAVHESNKIVPPMHPDAGFTGSIGNPLLMQDSRPPVNPAAVLLQVTTGTTGLVVGQPRLTARVAFAQGEIEVVVQSATIPRPGERLAVLAVEGFTVVVGPAPVRTTVTPLGSPALA
ncbi:MAG: flotillin-like FloA family protein [Planctomycetes bacterium]|nr:flotillin-like FloA family protein [Planctomycetota bacterium]